MAPKDVLEERVSHIQGSLQDLKVFVVNYGEERKAEHKELKELFIRSYTTINGDLKKHDTDITTLKRDRFWIHGLWMFVFTALLTFFRSIKTH